MNQWNADENETLFQNFSSNPKAKTVLLDAHQTKGSFVDDYQAFCGIIGVLPHPKLTYEEKPAGPDGPVAHGTEAVIEVKDHKVDAGTMKALMLALGRSKVLTRISFVRSELSARAAKELLDALPTIVPVTDLVVDWTPGFADALSKTVPPSLSTALGRVSTLSLRSASIADREAALIADVLGKNESINTLHLSDNKITDLGAMSMSEALRTNRALLVLSLSRNKITRAGAEHLAGSLGKFKLAPTQVAERKKLVQALEKKKKEAATKPAAAAGKGAPGKPAAPPTTAGKSASTKQSLASASSLKPTTPTSTRPSSATPAALSALPPDTDYDALLQQLQFEELEDGTALARGNSTLSYLNLSFNLFAVAAVKPLFDETATARQTELNVVLAELENNAASPHVTESEL